jgi:hypothetical protein
MFAPKGTPQPIVDRLADILNRGLNEDMARERLLELGAEVPRAQPARPGGLAGPGEERDRAPHADHCGRQRKIGPLTRAGGAAMRPIRWPHAIN